MKTRRLATMLAVGLALAGCATAVPGGPTPGAAGIKSQAARPKIRIESGGAIVAKHARIQLTPDVSDRQRHTLATADAFPYDIDYVSQVPPVQVGATTVQANDLVVCECGDLAFIAYNQQGDGYNGAIQVLDTSNKSAPRIVKNIRFPGMDINALNYHGSTLYFGGQADPEVFGYASFVGKIDLNDPTAEAIMSSIRGLHSFATTSIALAGARVYVGVGARDGGVEVLDTSLTSLSFHPRADVRSLFPYGNGVAGLAGTIDGGTSPAGLFTMAGATGAATFPDFGSRYAKATLEIGSDGLAFMAVSRDGFQVRRLTDEAPVYTLPNPGDGTRVAANGASSDGDLIFVANGEYGFRALSILDRGAKGDNFARVVGRHELAGATYDGHAYSANFLRFKGQTLFVASGLGGVNMYQVTKH